MTLVCLECGEDFEPTIHQMEDKDLPQICLECAIYEEEARDEES